MRRTLSALTATAVLSATALAAATVAPAQAITHGQPDGDGHPYVGMMLARSDAGAMWTCTGSLIDEDTFVTAGHCVEAPVTSAWVWVDEGPIVPGSAPEVTGSVHLHPAYDPADPTAHDLGVVELDTPVVLDRYAELPRVDQLDSLEPSVKTTFTAVGYGLHRTSPPQAGRQVNPMVRTVAHPRLLKINHKQTGEGSFMVSANASTGGTCTGDSGGPVLLGHSDVLAGVVSYGKNHMCAGQSGIYRVDRADDLAFLHGFVD